MSEKEPREVIYCRVPPSVHRLVKKLAAEEGISVNEWILRRMEKELGA